MRDRQLRQCGKNDISEEFLPPKATCEPTIEAVEETLDDGATLWFLLCSYVRVEERYTLLERIGNFSNEIRGIINTPHRLEK